MSPTYSPALDRARQRSRGIDHGRVVERQRAPNGAERVVLQGVVLVNLTGFPVTDINIRPRVPLDLNIRLNEPLDLNIRVRAYGET